MSGGVPMNMEEWALRMRAQKEQERKKKTESAEMLRGYRGGVKEDELKLRAQKEEERKKKTESAEMLRGYRGGVKEDELKLSALRMEERKKQQEAAQILHGYRGKAEGEGKERHVRQDPQYPPVASPKEEDDPSAMIAEGSVSEMAGKFSSPRVTDDVPVSSPTASFTTGVGSGSSDEKKVDANVLLPDPPQQPAPIVPDPPQQIMQEEEIIAPKEEEEEEAVEQQQVVAETLTEEDDEEEALHNQHPTVLRLDVYFSFGLVTATARPSLDGYMFAVEEVVKKMLKSKPQIAEHVSYNPSFGPFVQDCQWDANFVDPSGRPSVRRALVTAAVPVFLGNGISIHHAREQVVAALQESIQSGTFLNIAQELFFE